MCKTIEGCGCCPLNYDCDKPLTEECLKCLEKLKGEANEEKGVK